MTLIGNAISGIDPSPGHDSDEPEVVLSADVLLVIRGKFVELFKMTGTNARGGSHVQQEDESEREAVHTYNWPASCEKGPSDMCKKCRPRPATASPTRRLIRVYTFCMTLANFCRE